ncbi:MULTISPECIES: hypothetical protein [unclassified Bosea (in: a-proteobacteria)]|uniref:hypothetical protein n=1 Tax=unclassified Bosea (in: a-proteobacteria) TaxID=2653178 RepID=UPI000F765044|nr:MULTISPECIES: hypothetical protein [unclassified Bosea (in: a-proteobacteria)]AZO77476.1 hypothetical protein BLM15_07520 [Bosea sp. Tri-49]RXT18081.1 hypothetical protein B5U98_22670 [Bosea sp. Tri-39]RXT32679.1 hypothetical protein B5U99_29015 [Bosea sp. Tri-54]
MKSVLVLTALLLSACASPATVNRLKFTTFDIGKDGRSFVYVAQADAIHPHDTRDGEEYHQGVLQDWLRQNSLCPSDYVITNRRVLVETQGLFGTVAKITYEGRCKT